MKNGVKIFSIILFLWIIGCTYIYVCIIRKDCNCSSDKGKVALQTESLPVDTVKTETVPGILTIHFRLGDIECQLDENELNQIVKIEQYLSQNPEKTLLVTGHSDIYGPDIINQEMSYERAMFMKLKLVEGGVDPDIISVESKSSSQPVADNSTAGGRALNRRAETIIK